MPRRPTARSLVGAGVLLAALSACSGTEGSSGGDDPQAAASAAAAAAAEPGVAGGGLSDEQEAALLERLGAVDPTLGNGRSLGRARNVCQAVRRGATDAEVLETARARFATGDAEGLTDEQLSAVVTAVRETFCTAGASSAPSS